MNKWPIIWTKTVHRVNLDTGEPITKYEAEKEFTKIKKDKHVKINENRTRGHITETIGYRRIPTLF